MKKNNIILLIILIIIFLITVGYFIYQQYRYIPILSVVIKSDSYTYGNKVLSYAENPQLQYSNQYVTVYFSDGGAKIEIIHEVPIGFASGNMPEFKKTTDPLIALLTIGDADMGMAFYENYYINLSTKKVLKIGKTTGSVGSVIEITDANNQVSQIKPLIVDNCGPICKRREDMYATIKDLTVDDKLQNIITSPYSLRCLDPCGIGDIYSPAPVFTFLGINSDLSKVFFSFEGDNWNNGNKIILWKNNFSFNLINKIIKEENPINIL